MMRSRVGNFTKIARSVLLILISALFPFLFLGVVCVHAAGLVDTYKLALENDPLFQSAGFQKMAIEEGRNQAIAEFLPVLTGSASYTKTYQDIKSTDNTVVAAGDVNYGSNAFGLTLTQPLFHWDSFVGLDQSDAEILRVKAQYLLAGHDLMIRVASRYFEVLSAQDQRDFVVAEQAAVDKHFELASGRFDMGLIPITDLYDAKARKASVLAKSIEAQNLLDDARQALEEITSQPLVNIRPLKDEVDLVRPTPQNIQDWVDMALKQNPAIELQKYSVEVSALEVDKQHAGHYPTLDLVGHLESTDSTGSLYGGGTDGEVADIMVVLNVPFYAGGSVTSQTQEAKHLLSSAKQDFVRQQRAVVRETRAAYLGVNSAFEQIEALKQSVVANQLALEAKQEGFMSGVYTSLNVLDAERDLSWASIDYAKARYDCLLNNLKLKQAVGSLSDKDLFQLEQWLK